MVLPRPVPAPLVELIAQRLRVLGQPVRIRLIDERGRRERAGARRRGAGHHL